MKILFTGGGTAGHIIPIVAIIREIKLRTDKDDLQFFYIGPEDKFAVSLLKQEGVEIRTVLAGKLRRYFSAMNIIDIFKTPIGILQAFYHIFIISPDLIFSKGGYGSLPVVISGWALLSPIFLHESDISPGLANRISGRLAVEIFTAFPVEKTGKFPAGKMIAVGNPLRKTLLSGSTFEAKKIFGLFGKKPVVLVIGGSQGARRINDKMLVILPELLKTFEVIHHTGPENFKEVKEESEVVVGEELLRYYHPVSFLNEKELADAYAVSDIVISRAGAGAIFEIAALKKPSILVPLEGSAQNHQVRNAYCYAENGAAVVMEEANFTPHFLLERLKSLFADEKNIKKMSKNAKEFSRPEAAGIIAEYIISYLEQE